MRRAVALLALGIAAAPAVAAAKIQGPVAVLPFNNIGKNADLAWMSAGISETLLSDIERSGKLTVVERDQIEAALSELAFQESKAIDASSASAVGRVVGARTVVVGGYQQAGSQLRITARFVAVETGVIQETAKVTGKTVKIFELQDQIVRQLLSLAPPPPKGAKGARKTVPKPVKRPPPTEKTVKAYKLYAMSLTATTDAAARGFLVSSLEVDPHFVYAKDDLEALERRMRDLQDAAVRAMTEQEKAQRAILDDPETPELERSTAARKMAMQMLTSGRYRQLLELGEHVYGMEWRDPNSAGVREDALDWMFRSYDALGQYDRALQVGEQALQEFPTSMRRNVFDALMRAVISKKVEIEKARKGVAAQLAEADAELRELETRETPPEEWQRMGAEWKRCLVIYQGHQDRRAIHVCGEFLAKWAHMKNDQVGGNWYRIARLYYAEAHKNAGEYAEAQRLIRELIADEPDFAREMYLEGRARSWPQD